MNAAIRLVRPGRIELGADQVLEFRAEPGPGAEGGCAAAAVCRGCRATAAEPVRHVLGGFASQSTLVAGGHGKLSVSADGLRRVAVLLFGAPLAALVLGAWLGQGSAGELGSIGGALAAFVLVVAGLRAAGRRLEQSLEQSLEVDWQPLAPLRQGCGEGGGRSPEGFQGSQT